MNRLNLLLLLVLIASSALPRARRYESRRLFAELDKAQSEERQLDSEHERLKAEKQRAGDAAAGREDRARQAGDARRDAGGTQYVDAAERGASTPRRRRRR